MPVGAAQLGSSGEFLGLTAPLTVVRLRTVLLSKAPAPGLNSCIRDV
jgi:hypothetical protein